MIGIKGKVRPLELRFWEKVKKTNDCWIWIGAIDDRGYGSIGVNGRTRRAHRLSYEMLNGAIPKGLFVCHKCDNKKCVNPNHLFLGTAKDNTMDMIKKGRAKHAIGENAGRSKLTKEQVTQIRKRYKKGESTRKLASHYPVSHTQIWEIVTYRHWKWLKE